MAPEDGEVFILTTLVIGSELNFGVFRSDWISEIFECMFWLIFWTEFGFVDCLWFMKVCVNVFHV